MTARSAPPRSLSRLARDFAAAVRRRRTGDAPAGQPAAMDYAAFRALCANRRSIRYFSDQPVHSDEIKRLLELARIAPSVGNIQPWRFHIVMNRSLRRELELASLYGNFVTGAGVFLVVPCDRTAAKHFAEPLWNEKELEYSCMAAMMHVILGATAMGLGSCWVSLKRGDAHDILKLPPQEMVIGGLMIGRYRPGEEESNDQHQRKPLADACAWYG